MPKHTVTDTIIAGLQALGYVEQESSSRKYRKFTHPTKADVQPFHVGKAGALRYGRLASASVSMDRTDARRRIIIAGQKALGLLPVRSSVTLSDEERRGIADEASQRGAG